MLKKEIHRKVHMIQYNFLIIVHQQKQKKHCIKLKSSKHKIKTNLNQIKLIGSKFSKTHKLVT
jgi:hypothetical protein